MPSKFNASGLPFNGKSYFQGFQKGIQDAFKEGGQVAGHCAKGYWAYEPKAVPPSKELIESSYNCLEAIKASASDQQLQGLPPELRAAMKKWEKTGGFVFLGSIN